MEKKGTIISLIVLAIILAIIVVIIFAMGIIPNKYNYVQIEVNPKVEFICDKHYKVVSCYPLNNDAEVVISDLNLKGLPIDKASQIFLDECAKTGYLNINGIDNAVNITIIDGITQALDSRVTESVYNYFKDNEIMSVVIENYEDRKMFDEKKENDICCINKYKLVRTMSDQNSYGSFDKLKKQSEVKLVEMVANQHKEKPFIPTNEILNKKQQLVNNNSNIYNKHKKSITNSSKQEFGTLFDKFQKLSSKQYFEDFNKEYNNWLEKKNV